MSTVDANAWIASFDPTDVFHVPSTELFRRAVRRGLMLHCPAFVIVEVAGALARRLRDRGAGLQAAADIRAHPLVRLHPLDQPLIDEALRLSTQQFLRGADALYAATASLTGTDLISWDGELIRRAGAVSPADWLAANP